MKLDLVSRRAALVGAAAAVLAPGVATAGTWCSTGRYGETICTAGLSINEETVRQLKPHWCWAACIQTIFALHGYNVAQDAIVHKVFGKDIDRSANGPEIMSAVNGLWTGDRGRKFNANGTVLWNRVDRFERPDALEFAARELAKGNPLIFATEGHSMVLTAMTYLKAPDGTLMVDSLTVRDPWPSAPNRRRLREDEVDNSGLMCAVQVEAV